MDDDRYMELMKEKKLETKQFVLEQLQKQVATFKHMEAHMKAKADKDFDANKSMTWAHGYAVGAQLTYEMAACNMQVLINMFEEVL